MLNFINLDCGGAEYARSNGIPVLVFPKAKREPSDGLSPSELVDVLRLAYLLEVFICIFTLGSECVYLFVESSLYVSQLDEQEIWCRLCSFSWIFETYTGRAGPSFS